MAGGQAWKTQPLKIRKEKTASKKANVWNQTPSVYPKIVQLHNKRIL